MITKAIKSIWTLAKLPVKLVMLPFKIVSTILSIMFYLTVLGILGVIVYFFVL